MKVLGRDLIGPFDRFWEQYGPDVPVSTEVIEDGHSLVFGALGADRTAPETPSWLALPDAELAYHVAHELTHMVMRQHGFPRTALGPEFREGSAEAKIGGDIEEMVLHPALDNLLRPFGFRKDAIQARMLEGTLTGLARSPVPARGTPWFYTWAVRYCELKLDLTDEQWRPVETLYEERSPRVCELGRELLDIMRQTGWGTPAQALEAMVAVRDRLGLGVDGSVLVIDPIGGSVL